MEEKGEKALSDHLAKFQKIKKAITKVFTDDESRFRLFTTIKICLIPLITLFNNDWVNFSDLAIGSIIL